MAELLRAATHPGEEAVRDDGGSWTYAELDGHVNALVHVLRSKGLGPGERLALAADNSRMTFAILLACLHAGLEVVPVNTDLTAREMGQLFTRARPRLAVAEARLLDRAGQALGATGPGSGRILCLAGEAAGVPALWPLVEAAPHDEPEGQRCGAVLLFTSGSQGPPKPVVGDTFHPGAPLRELARTALRGAALFGFPGRGRALVVGPWYHAAQLFFSLFPLLRGVGLVLHRRFDAARTLEEIDRSRIRLCHLVPTQLVRLLRLEPGLRAHLDGSSLERVWHGGGPCPVPVKQAMLDWWGPVLHEYYGATEGGVLTTIGPEQWVTRPGSVGRAVAGTELVVVGSDGEPLPAGEVGTVYARRDPSHGFRYLDDEAATAAAHLAPGVFTYGDQGYLDGDGFLYLTGRGQDRIVSGGVNVSASEVAGVLLLHPAVRDAAVLARPDEEFGERVTAVVELERTWMRRDIAEVLQEHCRAHLAGYKIPRRIELVDLLPRDPTGKLRRAPLDRVTSSRGEGTVVTDGAVSFTRAIWEDRVARLATVLERRGVQPGEHVAWIMPNRAEVLQVALACKRLGAVLVPLSYRSTLPELRRLLGTARPAVIACDRTTVQRTVDAGGGCVLDLDDDGLRAEWAASEPAPPAPAARPDRLGAPSSLVFTSGTTGLPKAVLRTSGDARLSATIAGALGFDEDVRYVVSGPLYHSGPGTCALMALARGGLVGMAGPFDAARWLGFVRRERMNATFITPTQLRAVVEAIEQGVARPTTLRHVVTSGEAFTPELKERAVAALGECLADVYGSTELGPMTMMPPERLLEKPTSCGRPFDGVDIKAFGAGGPLGADEVGELRARTGLALAGYLDGAAFRGRTTTWVGVGDLGFVDRDGDVHVVGRSDDVIISGGVNVHPADVEEVLRRHPAVRDCVVIGLPDERWGQAVTAAVVADGDLDLDGVRAWMRGKIADDKRPRRMVLLESLPRTQTEKVSRRATRDLMAGGVGAPPPQRD